MNSIPAISNARQMAASSASETWISPSMTSALRIVATPTVEARAKARAVHRIRLALELRAFKLRRFFLASASDARIIMSSDDICSRSLLAREAVGCLSRRRSWPPHVNIRKSRPIDQPGSGACPTSRVRGNHSRQICRRRHSLNPRLTESQIRASK